MKGWLGIAAIDLGLFERWIIDRDAGKRARKKESKSEDYHHCGPDYWYLGGSEECPSDEKCGVDAGIECNDWAWLDLLDIG